MDEAYAQINNIIEYKSLTTKGIYSKILQKKVLPPKSSHKWNDDVNREPHWAVIAKCKIKNQLEVKIAEFNFKLLHKILATNENLFKWQKTHSPNCIYCNNVIHMDKHLLWDCPNTNASWMCLGNIILA
jgi:tRNA U34 2-thiouridine synthase MnmA/TrmU